MRNVTLGLCALFFAALAVLQNCKSQSAADPGLREPRPGARREDGFPEVLPTAWDGRSDYAGSAFTIQ